MARAVEWGIRFGIWFISDVRRPVATVGFAWINTLKGPLGNWARAQSWRAITWGARSAIGGAVFTATNTWNKLIVPTAIWARPAVTRVGTRIAVGATIAGPPVLVATGVLATAAVIAGVHTAALQQAGIVGPSAITTSDPSWFGGLEMNPYMFSMGSVV